MRRNGFTLVELVVYMGLLSVILVVLTTVFVSLVDLQLETQASSSLETDEAFIVNRLSTDIRNAEDIATPAANGDNGTTLELTVDGDVVTYTVSGGNITRTDTAGTFQINSFDTTVTGLDFLRLGVTGGKSSIRISFTLENDVAGNQTADTREIKTTVAERL